MLTIPPPRLLPMTIAAMAALLVLKCGILLQAAANNGAEPDGVMVTVAKAAGTEASKEPGTERGEQHGRPTAASVPKPASPGAGQHLAAPVPEGPPPVSASEKALLQELRQRRMELDARADGIAARESVLAAAEQRVDARVSELQALQKKLEGLDAAEKQREDAGWQGLVKLYETMKPKDAATIFNELSMPVLLQVMDRMKDAKAASIMAALNPDKARDVTAELARMRTGRDPSAVPLAGAGTDQHQM